MYCGHGGAITYFQGHHCVGLLRQDDINKFATHKNRTNSQSSNAIFYKYNATDFHRLPFQMVKIRVCLYCCAKDHLCCMFCKVITGSLDAKQTPLSMEIAMYGPKMLFLGELCAKYNKKFQSARKSRVTLHLSLIET